MTATLTRHASANIMSNPVMSAANARADITTVAGLLATRTGSVGWQEIDPTNYQSYVTDQAPRVQTYWPGGAANAVPISWSSDLALTASGVILTHPGELHVTPNRYVAWAVLEDSAGDAFWHINTHYISQAWTTNPERQARWLIHNQVLIDTVRKMQTEHGPTGIITGDFNRDRYVDPTLSDLGGSYHWPLAPTEGRQYLDYLISFGRWTSPSGVTRVAVNSDHDTVVLDLALPTTPPPPPPPPPGPVVFVPPTPPPVMPVVPGDPIVSVWRHASGPQWTKVATVAAHTTLSFIPTHQDAGSWSLTAPYSVGSELTPGRLVTIDWRGTRSTWLIGEFHPSQGLSGSGSDTSAAPVVLVTGKGAKAMLGWALVYPDATNPLEAQPIYLDTKAAPYVGPAETILATLAALNLRDRYGLAINIPTPSGLGDTVKVRPKFDNLFELTQTFAKDAGIGFDIGLESQPDSPTKAELWLRYFESEDKTATVRLTSALGTIAAWEQADTEPNATHALVGFGQNFTDVQTTLAQDVTAGATSIVVQSSAGFPTPNQDTPTFRVVVADELMTVTKVTAKTWTVTRGVGSTVPAAHTAGDPVRATRFYKVITTPTSLDTATAWNGKREVYVEGPDTTDAAEVAASGRASLSDGAETRALSVTASEAAGMRAFIHYNVGDIVTAEVATGASAVAPIMSIEVTVDDNGITVRPQFGNPGAINSSLAWALLIRDLRRAQRKKERE